LHVARAVGATSPAGLSRIFVLAASRDDVKARGLLELLRSIGVAARGCQPADLHAAPDLAQADIVLFESPRLGDGDWAVLERVRERSPMVEILVASSDPEVAHAVQALRSGVFAVLQHPVTAEQLAAAVLGAYARKCRGEQRMLAISAERSPSR